jgi:formylglycine-generating enzyme required for sulfatase activity
MEDLPTIAADLAQSPIEAVRRASWRVISPISGSALSLLRVPSGDYLVGVANAPVSVHLTGFAISRYLVSNLEFAQFVDATDASPPPHWDLSAHDSAVEAIRHIADYPVVFVSYFDALKYCEFRSDEIHKVRLPTETEWEVSFSLRDDFTQRLTTYTWGNDFDSRKCNTAESGIGRVTPIGLYNSTGGDTEAGIADLCGNVWEWTCSRGRGIDGTEVEYPRAEEHYDAVDATVWAPRVQRGGTFIAEAGYATRTFRLINLPDLPLQDFGFRIVVMNW